MKKFLALLMALTLCLSMAAPAFAASVSVNTADNNGGVVYENDSIVVYDTRSGVSPRATTYESKWFNASGSLYGDEFKIYTGLSGRFGVTFGLEASSRSTEAQIMFKNPSGRALMLNNAHTGTTLCQLGNVSGEWRTEEAYVISGQPSGTYTVDITTLYAPSGARIMCWIYDV